MFIGIVVSVLILGALAFWYIRYQKNRLIKLESVINDMRYRIIKPAKFNKGLLPGLRKGMARMEITSMIKHTGKVERTYLEYTQGDSPMVDDVKLAALNLFLRNHAIEWKE